MKRRNILLVPVQKRVGFSENCRYTPFLSLLSPFASVWTMYRLFGVYKSQIYFMRIETCFFWLPLLVEAFINSVIFPEEMGWFIIGFLVLYFSIVGHVCWTQNWFIVMWKMCSFLEMKDGKDPLRASHYCKNLLKDLLCPTFTSLSTCSDSSGEGLPPSCFVLLSTTSCDYALSYSISPTPVLVR